MRIKLYYLKNKRFLLFSLLLFTVGLYIAVLRLNSPESVSFDDLYFYAREGSAFDIESDGFNIQTFVSVLNIVIAIPMICSCFSTDYIKKQYFFAIRFKNFNLFFINEVANIAVSCFVFSISYSFGILICCFKETNFELTNSNFLILYLFSVLNSALLLFTFSIIALPFLILYNKAAILGDIIIFMSCTVASYYLPGKYKYADIIMIYFVNMLFHNGSYFSYETAVCYLIIIIVISVFYQIGKKSLRSIETK